MRLVEDGEFAKGDATRGWGLEILYHPTGTRDGHVAPLRGTPHVASRLCWCVPTVKPYSSIGFIVSHKETIRAPGREN